MKASHFLFVERYFYVKTLFMFTTISPVYSLKKCHTYRHSVHIFHKHFIMNPLGYIFANIYFHSALSLRQCHARIAANSVVKQEWNGIILLVTKSVDCSLSVPLNSSQERVLSSLFALSLSQNRLLVISCLRYLYQSS